MKIKVLLSTFLFFASQMAALVAGETLLRVAFIPDKLESRGTLDGFEPFLVPTDHEVEKVVPIAVNYNEITVTISGAALTLPSQFPEEEGSIITRFRSLTPDQELFSHSKLFRSWVGAPKVLAIKISGLKPDTKYRLKFYACDITEGSLYRSNAVVIHDLESPGNDTSAIEWGEDTVMDESMNLDKQTATLEVKTSKAGELTVAATSEIKSNPLLNGFEIETLP